MTQEPISVVVETVTAREGGNPAKLADALAGTLNALADQTRALENVEKIVVVDPTIDAAEVQEVRRRFPDVSLVEATRPNYFEAKNAGAAAATGEIVVLLDGDTVPEPEWLAQLLSRFTPDVDVVAGRTRYTATSHLARACSIPDFAQVLEADGGMASGFNINNLAVRKGVLEANPLDGRIRRNGGCYLLYRQLRTSGKRIVYEPRASVSHAFDGAASFIKKHFERGFDGQMVYGLDERGALRGTRYVRRFGALAILPIGIRRLLLDWARVARHRRQMGIAGFALPYYAALMTGVRAVEAAGAFTAVIDPDRYRR